MYVPVPPTAAVNDATSQNNDPDILGATYGRPAYQLPPESPNVGIK